MWSDYIDEDKVVICLTNKVKEKIVNFCDEESQDFDEIIESFIEDNFARHETLNLYFYKYSNGHKSSRIALKVENGIFVLLLDRSNNRDTQEEENYFVCLDVQKKPEINPKKTPQYFYKIEAEIDIPVNFSRNDEPKESDLIEDIVKKVDLLEPYQPPSLDESKEFQKWYAYLTLMEKLVDAKDFFFEADNIEYSNTLATVEITDTELFKKIKKAKGEFFNFYLPDSVDQTQPLHTWDENKKNRNNEFGELEKKFTHRKIHFKLDKEFIKKYSQKYNSVNKDIISLSLDFKTFCREAGIWLEDKLKKHFKDDSLKLHDAIEKIKNKEQKENLHVIREWRNKFSHPLDGKLDINEEEEKKNINKTLKTFSEKILKENNNEKQFNPPRKLILRVSYFREQFQLRTLKWRMDRIKKHPLRPYIFGDKKVEEIPESEWKNISLNFLSKQLNNTQKEAVLKALASRNIFMIQGPPGTGKTEVISEIAYQEAKRGKTVLISSQANMAVDNAIQRLNSPELYPVRIIRKDYEPEEGDSLPIKENIATFYRDRISRELEKEIIEFRKEWNLIEGIFIRGLGLTTDLQPHIPLLSKLHIDIPENLELSDPDDREDLVRIIEDNKEILRKYYVTLKQKNQYLSIQKDFQKEINENEHTEEMEHLNSSYLKNVNIWGATLFEVGKYSFKDLPAPNKNFDTVIIDEISKAMPPELVLAILKAEKLILVGDHKQLPPVIKDVSLEDLANELEVSVKALNFEKTVFESLIEKNPHAFVMLDTQYRMHPDIQKAINQFYNRELKCGLKNPDFDKDHGLSHPDFKKKHIFWLDTPESAKEQKPEGSTSFTNETEVKMIENMLSFLNKEYEKLDKRPSVGVITFYGRQLGELKKLENPGYWKDKSKRKYKNLNLRFGTVDRFQGQEKDIIIVSMVRNNQARTVGFAKKPNRINVAFSRAKKMLIITGNFRNFAFGRDSQSSKQYGEIFNITKKFGKVFTQKEVVNL